MGKCKECARFLNIENTKETGMGLCSFPNSYFEVNQENDCVYIPKSYVCGDCARLHFDDGCMTCQENDSAYHNGHICGGFIDRRQENVEDALYDWKLRGYDIDAILNKIKYQVNSSELPFVKKDEHTGPLTNDELSDIFLENFSK